jgi:cell shape-determining protein MreC
MRWLAQPITSQQWFATLVFGLFGWWFVEYLGLLGWGRVAGEKILAPLWTAAYNSVQLVVWPVAAVKNASTARLALLDLEIKYQLASAQLTEVQRLQEEHQALRGLLENTDRQLIKSYIAAPIVSYGTPFLNRGEADGIRPGNLVLVANALVGRVLAVTPHQAEVQLLSHPASQPILVQTESGVKGMIVGDGQNIILTEVPPDAKLEQDQRVVTAGQVGIARDLFIGRISKVEQLPQAATQRAIISQTVSFFDVRVVEVYP